MTQYIESLSRHYN